MRIHKFTFTIKKDHELRWDQFSKLCKEVQGKGPDPRMMLISKL